MLSVFILNAILLSVVILNAFTMSVVILNVIMLSVVEHAKHCFGQMSVDQMLFDQQPRLGLW